MLPMWITHKNKKGFTLIELLVVVAIIGILTTIASVSLVQARRRARDTKRVSDIQQVRNALVIYSNQRATYPLPNDPETRILGGSDAGCLDDSLVGFRAAGTCGTSGELMIMQRVPGEAVAGHAFYIYKRINPQDYMITFTLEGEIGDLPGGICTANVNGISCVP